MPTRRIVVPPNDGETSTPVEIVVKPEAAKESSSGIDAIDAKDNNEMSDKSLIEHEPVASPTPTANQLKNVTEGENVTAKPDVSIQNTNEPAEFNTVVEPNEQIFSESNHSEAVESVQTEVETKSYKSYEITKDNPTDVSVEQTPVIASDNIDESSSKKPKKNQVSPEVTSPLTSKKTKKNQIVPFDMVTDGRPTSAQSMRYHTNRDLFTTQRTTTNLRSSHQVSTINLSSSHF